jgi:hypothetical protein
MSHPPGWTMDEPSPVLLDLGAWPKMPLPDPIMARILDQFGRAGDRLAAVTTSDEGR